MGLGMPVMNMVVACGVRNDPLSRIPLSLPRWRHAHENDQVSPFVLFYFEPWVCVCVCVHGLLHTVWASMCALAHSQTQLNEKYTCPLPTSIAITC